MYVQIPFVVINFYYFYLKEKEGQELYYNIKTYYRPAIIHYKSFTCLPVPPVHVRKFYVYVLYKYGTKIF